MESEVSCFLRDGRLNSHGPVHAVSILVPTIVAALLCGAGCAPDAKPTQAPPASRLSATELARVGDAVITRQAFEQEWRRRANVRDKDDLLQQMLRFESLLARARAAGVDRDPEVVAAFNRMVVGRFQEQQLQQRGLDSISLGEEEVRAAYSNQIERFSAPPQVRLGIIHCKVSAKATPEKREALRQRANDLWKQASESDNDGFRRLALQHSDDQVTRYAGGDSGWIDLAENDSRRDPAVRQAAAALTTPGDFAPFIETEHGFYIVKLLDARPKSVRPLEQVRGMIEHQLRAEKARQIHESFFKEMQAGLPIEINRAALDAVPQPVRHAQTAAPPSLPK